MGNDPKTSLWVQLAPVFIAGIVVGAGVVWALVAGPLQTTAVQAWLGVAPAGSSLGGVSPANPEAAPSALHPGRASFASRGEEFAPEEGRRLQTAASGSQPSADRLMVVSEPGWQGPASRSTAFAPAGEEERETAGGAAAPSTAPGKASGRVARAEARASYGSATRGEIMGRGAGPVYNLRGGSRSTAGGASSLLPRAPGTDETIREARRQIESADMLDPKTRKALNEQVDQAEAEVRKAAAQ